LPPRARLGSPLPRFHNLSNAALADALGYADAVLKDAEVEAKDKIKQRGLLEAAADSFGADYFRRPDVAAVKRYSVRLLAALSPRSRLSSASRP
jgi:hypothetical protein